MAMRDRRATILEIAKEVGISTFSAHFIMSEDLSMRRVAAKFELKLLTVEQNQLVLKSHRTCCISQAMTVTS